MSLPRPKFNRKAFIAARVRAGVSVPSLSATTGLNPATLYRIEDGTHPTPRADTVKKIADALEVDVTDLLVIEDAA